MLSLMGAKPASLAAQTIEHIGQTIAPGDAGKARRIQGVEADVEVDAPRRTQVRRMACQLRAIARQRQVFQPRQRRQL